MAAHQDVSGVDSFVALVGRPRWLARLSEISDLAASGPRAGQAIRQRHGIELSLEKLRRRNAPQPNNPGPTAAERQLGQTAAERQLGQTAAERQLGQTAAERQLGQTAAERQLGQIAAAIPRFMTALTPRGRDRLNERLQLGLSGQNTLIPLFHLIRTAMLQRSRGFTVAFSGLENDTPHDLLLRRDDIEAEVACDVVTAEEGRRVHRGAWFRLADRIDPDLQTWLADHPGRYLLKMTLPLGLRGGLHDGEPGGDALGQPPSGQPPLGQPQSSQPQSGQPQLGQLHQRIRAMLETRSRQDFDEAIMLRLDPLLLAGAQAEDIGLISSLRREFGPEAHLSVTTSGRAVFVMAARAGQENEVAIAIGRRLAALSPTRLTGTRPGILSLFVEDIDRLEWRGLRDRLELEGEARQFMINPEGRKVVALSFVSRLEMFGAGEPDAAPDGELRFRNAGHPAAKFAALAPAVMSSV
jgi:hypothetical protein